MTPGARKPPLAGLDLRVCLFLMVLTSVMTLLLRTETALLCMLVLLIIWLGLFGLKRQLISHLIWYFILWGGLYLLSDIPTLGSTALPLVTVYVRRLMLPVMAARPLLAASNGRLVASLNRMKLPKAATLSLAVLFRFMPTISEEYRHIRDAQKFRGIGVSLWSSLCHPFRLLEYTLIPMLIRTSKTADELSASAAVRGMRLKGEVSSYHLIRMKTSDWAAIIIGTLILFGVAYIERIVGGA
ncbi:MAG: energy-coupling factor transporter transmembrane component T [Suipraeoptans sp.]